MDPGILISILVRMAGPAILGNSTVVCNSPDYKHFAMFSINSHPELHLVNHVRHGTPEVSLEYFETKDFELSATEKEELILNGPFHLQGKLGRSKKDTFTMVLDQTTTVNCYYAP